MKTFFSIILPTYNRAYIIDRTIRSVLAQTFIDWQLIIVDDGSTDDTSTVVARYDDPRIQYYQKVHAERSAARNYGLEKASGRYICFLDSDDEYLPAFLSLHHQAILGNPSYHIFRVGTYLVKDGERTALPFPDPRWSALEAICKNFNSPGSYCFEREGLKKFRFDERFNIGEDFHFVMSVTNEWKNIRFINHFGFMYYYNIDSDLVFLNSLEKMNNKLNCFKDLLLRYTWPKLVDSYIRGRIIIVYFLGMKLFLRSKRMEILPIVLNGLFYIMIHPLLTLITVYNLKIKDDRNETTPPQKFL